MHSVIAARATFGADLHDEDPAHRLAGCESQHRGVILRHRRRDLVLPQIVQRQLALPQRQPGDLDHMVGPRRGRGSRSTEQPVPACSSVTSRRDRESPAAAAN